MVLPAGAKPLPVKAPRGTRPLSGPGDLPEFAMADIAFRSP